MIEGVGKDLDVMVAEDAVYANVVKSVVVDMYQEHFININKNEPMTQMSKSRLELFNSW